MKKITLSTIKSFIKHNKGYLHISNRSDFDGRIDCVTESNDTGFRRAKYLVEDLPNTEGLTDTDAYYRLGISGAWFVRESRDHFTAWEDENWIGYEIYNCCGCFILAVPKGHNHV